MADAGDLRGHVSREEYEALRAEVERLAAIIDSQLPRAGVMLDATPRAKAELLREGERVARERAEANRG